MPDVEEVPGRRAASEASKRPRRLPSRVVEGERSEPDQKKPSWGKRALVLGFALFAGAWGWAFWYEAHRPKPEPLDAASKHAASTVCKAAIADLRKLPQVGGAPTVDIRVRRISAEDTILTRLVHDLDAIRPSDHSGAEALTGFAADWRHLVDARQHYVDQLRATGKRPKLYLPVAPSGEPITIRMGQYTNIHFINECSPASLQGEVVEGRRTYPRVT
jgi:hypothetical protein